MSREREDLYLRTLAALAERRLLTADMSVLVAGGGAADRDVLRSRGFSNVTLSNMCEAEPHTYAPYRFDVQDIESLDYEDAAFDWAIVSAALHHCRSPHRGLLELYRVARRGVVALESRDSVAMRLALRLGAVDPYELTAVAAGGFRAGGVRNTGVPNYVYRWTEREVEKTIASYAPEVTHRFMYFRDLELPLSIFAFDARRGRVGALLRAAHPILRGLTRVAPRQANLLAFVVVKPPLSDALQPWLRLENGKVVADEEWISRRLAP